MHFSPQEFLVVYELMYVNKRESNMNYLIVEPKTNPMLNDETGASRTIFIHTVDSDSGTDINEDGVINLTCNNEHVYFSDSVDGVKNKTLELPLRTKPWEIYLLIDDDYVLQDKFIIKAELKTTNIHLESTLETYFEDGSISPNDMKFALLELKLPGGLVTEKKDINVMFSAFRGDYTTKNNKINITIPDEARGHIITYVDNNEVDHGNSYTYTFPSDLASGEVSLRFDKTGLGSVTYKFVPEKPADNSPEIKRFYGISALPEK